MHLDAERGDLDADVGGIGLRHRREQVRPLLPVPPFVALGRARPVDRHRAGIGDGARGVGEGAHRQQRPTHVRVLDDRAHAATVPARRAALAAVAGVGDRLLRRPLGDADPLDTDLQACVVHHREHALQALVRLADEVADRAFAAVAEAHDAGRRGVQAELVLDRAADDVVARAEAPIRLDQKLRHQEQRNPLGAGGRVRQAGEHQVDDVVGEVVLAEGDEDLLAEQAVAAVRRRLGAGPQRREVGARLRLGQVHRPHPLAGDELLEEDALKFRRGVGRHRLDGGDGQGRPEPEGERRGVPHLEGGDAERDRQALAAVVRIGDEPVPARLPPLPIGLLPARRRRHRARLEAGSDAVADGVERRHPVGGEAASLRQHGVDEVVRQVADRARRHGVAETGDVAQREGDLLDRCPVGHVRSLLRRAGLTPRSRSPTGARVPSRLSRQL